MEKGCKTGLFLFGELALYIFEKLKKAFTSALILVHYILERLIILETDILKFTISAVLLQFVKNDDQVK